MRWWACVAVCLALIGAIRAQDCETQADVVFVIDGSTALTNQEFDRVKTFVINYAQAKSLSSASRLFAGLVVVGEGVETQVEITDDMNTFAQEVSAARYPAGRTLMTSTGIEVAFSKLIIHSAPAGTRKVMIVIVAQISSQPASTKFSADFSRDVNIEVFSVGLNGVDQGELENIAGGSANVRRLNNVFGPSALPDIRLNLAGVDCDGGPVTQPTLPPTTPTTTTTTTTRPTTPTTTTTTTTTTTRRTPPTTPTTTTTTTTTTPQTRRPTTPTTTTTTTRRTTTTTTRRTPAPTTPTTTSTTTRRPFTTRPTPSTTTRTSTTTRRSRTTSLTPSTTQRASTATTRTTGRTTSRPTTFRPTTTRPTTTTSTTPRVVTLPPTPRPLRTDSLCQDSTVVNGVGYVAYPRQPDKYIQCYFPPDVGGRRRKRQTNAGFLAVSMGVTNTMAIVRQCPFGLFWNQESRTCELASTVEVSEDTCSGPQTRNVDGNCRAYYLCANGRPVPNCCPMGYAYSPIGCVVCPGCLDTCSMATSSRTYACSRYPVWNDPTRYRVYRWDVEGGSYVEQACRESCYFNLATCDCTVRPWRAENDTNVCAAKIDIPFFGVSSAADLKDISITNFGEAVLNGDTSKIHINLEDDASFADYGGPLLLQFRYKESEEIVSRQVLVASTKCDRPGFLQVTVDRENILVEVTTEGGVLTSLSVPTEGFKPNEWKNFRLVDNNDYMMLMVSDGEDGYAARVMAPANPYVQCGLDIGSADFVDGFKGSIDQFSIYQCIPTGIVA